MFLDITLNDAKLMRNIVEALTAIVDEAKFHAGDFGWEVLAMDPSRSAMVDFAMPRDSFDNFENEGELSFGVNLRELMDVLKLAGGEDSLRMKIDPDSGRLSIELTGSSSRKEFKLSLLDLGGEGGKRLKIPFDFKMEISSALYTDIVKTAEAGGEQVVIEATDELVTISSSTPSREVKFEIPKDSPEVMEFKVDTTELPVKASYSLKYLKDFQKATKISDMVSIEFSTDKPMKLTFPINNGGHISYAVAPRLEY